jgi:hypothetical protein
MKKFTVIAIVLLFATAAWAGSGTSRTYGGTTYHTFDDGTTGTSRQYGGTTHHSFSDGTTGTSRQYGGTMYHNFNEPQESAHERQQRRIFDSMGIDNSHPLHPDNKTMSDYLKNQD